MQTIIPHPAKNCKTFSTVVPMKVTGIKQRRTRPQPIVCPGCKGTRQLEYVNPDTLEIEVMPCLFCGESGIQFRNADHTEHRSLLSRLGGLAWNAVKAVIL